MTSDEAAILLQCRCPGLPGADDPRIAKAAKLAAKDTALQADLARQHALDERQIAAIEQIPVPQPLLARLAEGHATTVRQLGGKAFLLQPVGIAILIGAATMLGWGGVSVWNRAHSFPGKDNVMRMVEVNDEMTGMEMVPIKEEASSLNDWFFEKYNNFEDYFVPAGFEKFKTAGARLFKQDDEPVAQVAIPDPDMIFFSFKADNFGVNIPDDQWHTFTDGDWVAAVQRHNNECFMVTFRGSGSDMDKFLAGLGK